MSKILEEKGYDWVREKHPEAVQDEEDLTARAQPPCSPPDHSDSRENKEGIQAMTTDLNLQVAGIKDDYKYGFRDSEENYSFDAAAILRFGSG